MKKVAIIYLSYHSEPYLDDVISALSNLTYPKEKIEFIIVDNPHPKHGLSRTAIEEKVIPFSGNEIPHVTYLPQEKNLGFAGGNNVGIKWALENNFDYVYLHNDDGFVKPDFIEPLIETMEQDKKIGAAQSLIILHPETDLVNTSGNVFHYLGFAYGKDYRRKASELNLKPVQEINYASGSGMMMRADLLKQFGGLDEDLFMYHEDLEYCLRLKMAGCKSVVVRDSIFYHKHKFAKSKKKFYWIERNRPAIMLMYFKIPTLIFLTPMLIIMELGSGVFSLLNGVFRQRMRVCFYWLKPKNWRLWLKKRGKIQKTRKIKDRDILKESARGIHFQEKSMQNPFLKYVANPLMRLYYWVVIRMLVWW